MIKYDNSLNLVSGDARYLKLDQTTPQTIINGSPIMESTNRWYFRDSNAYVYSDAANQITLAATTLTTIGVAGDISLGDGTLRKIYPATTGKMDLGSTAYMFNNVYAATYYTSGGQVNYNLSVYASGSVYSLTATPAKLDFGTTDPVLVLDKSGTYLIIGRCQLEYNGATFAANRTTTIKLRRTNNTAADLGNGSVTAVTAVITTLTYTFVNQTWQVLYTTANTDDSIELYGSIDVVPTAGSMDAVEASIVAIRLY